MSDPIERQDVIDEAEKWIEAYNSGRGGQRERDAIKHVISGIKKLPSAQPETHEERTETHACDLLSRQAAIDALDVGAEVLRRVLDDADIVCAEREKYKWGLGLIESCISDINELPPAQPEIVQCEDCQHWEQETINDGYCTEMDLRMCDADFYCGYAERRTDEADYRKE